MSVTGKYQALKDSYFKIKNCRLLTEKTLTEQNINEFQDMLNEAQPYNNEEVADRRLIQFLYRKNPNNFCQYLARSGVSSFVLWTESKSIVTHFGLKGIVYVKWDENKYACSLHRSVVNDPPQKVYENIGRRDFSTRNKRYQQRQQRFHEPPVIEAETPDQETA